MKFKALTGAAFFASAFLFAPASQAATIGDTVTCAEVGSGTFTCANGSAVIGAGTEFNIGNGSDFFLGADFDTGSLFIDALQNSSLGGTILEFTNLTSPFTSVSLVSSTGFNGFDASDISLTGGVLSLNLIGTQNSAGGQIRLALNSTPAVPEPGTWAMMLVGFGAVGAAMRRRPKMALQAA